MQFGDPVSEHEHTTTNSKLGPRMYWGPEQERILSLSSGPHSKSPSTPALFGPMSGTSPKPALEPPTQAHADPLA